MAVSKKKTKTGREKSLANLKPSKPGMTNNPNGRPTLAEVERNAREASRREISEYYQEMKDLSIDDLRAIVSNKKTTALKAWFATSFIKGIQKGDLSELHRMYDRILGKPKQELDLGAREGSEGVTFKLEIVRPDA